jgi:exodeoxyribonuclease VII small subunit
MDKKLTYAKAYKEIETLMQKMQNEQISDLDEMVNDVKKVSELISFCREKLRKAESDLNESSMEIKD